MVSRMSEPEIPGRMSAQTAMAAAKKTAMRLGFSCGSEVNPVIKKMAIAAITNAMIEEGRSLSCLESMDSGTKMDTATMPKNSAPEADT